MELDEDSVNAILVSRLEKNVLDAKLRNVGVRIGRRKQNLINEIKIRRNDGNNLQPSSSKMKLVDLEASFKASALSIKQLRDDDETTLQSALDDLDTIGGN